MKTGDKVQLKPAARLTPFWKSDRTRNGTGEIIRPHNQPGQWKVKMRTPDGYAFTYFINETQLELVS